MCAAQLDHLLPQLDHLLAVQYMGSSGAETERIAAETEKRVAATYEAVKSRKEDVVSMLISFVTNVDTSARPSAKK